MKEKYIVDDMLDKVLNKIKEIIGIEKSGNTKILIDKEDKLPNDIILKNVAILITCVINDDNKFYRQLFLGKALFVT